MWAAQRHCPQKHLCLLSLCMSVCGCSQNLHRDKHLFHPSVGATKLALPFLYFLCKKDQTLLWHSILWILHPYLSTLSHGPCVYVWSIIEWATWVTMGVSPIHFNQQPRRVVRPYSALVSSYCGSDTDMITGQQTSAFACIILVYSFVSVCAALMSKQILCHYAILQSSRK